MKMLCGLSFVGIHTRGRQNDLLTVPWTKESIFVVGGSTAEQDVSTKVDEFLVKEGRWRERACLTVARRLHAATVWKAVGGGTLLGVFGGVGADTSFEVFEVSQDRWHRLPDLRVARWAPTAACRPNDGRVFVFGGLLGSSTPASVEFCHLGADWQETVDVWQEASPMRTARRGLVAVHFRGRIIVAGGDNGYFRANTLNVVEMFKPPGTECPLGQWTELAGMTKARYRFTLLAFADAVFALGND